MTNTADTINPEAIQDRLNDNIARNTRALISQRGLKRADFCEALGMSRQTFSSRLTSLSRFTAAELIVVAYLLGVSVERLGEEPGHLMRVTDDPDGPPIRARLEDFTGGTLRTGSRWITLAGVTYLPTFTLSDHEATG